MNKWFWQGCLPIYLGVIIFALALPIFAQAPTDEWRRGGLDAMVAEPGQANSLLSNPAGIKTNEERHKVSEDKDDPGKKYEWIIEMVSLDFFLTGHILDLIKDPSKSGIQSQLGLINETSDIIGGSVGARQKSLDLIKGLGKDFYNKLISDTRLAGINLENLSLEDLRNLTEDDKNQLQKNLKDTDGLLNQLTNSFIKLVVDQNRNIGFEHYSRTLSFAHVNDKRPLAWGFYLGLEQKLALQNGVQSVGVPLELKIEGLKLKTQLPIGFQLYLVVPLRLAFAHNFGEALPGFTFGLGFKAVPYFGMNQNGLGNLISSLQGKADILELGKNLFGLSGINIGFDLGIQFHFGSILPQLEFLHMGLKISDILGFNVPFGKNGDDLRYAVDFDLGIYAEYQLWRFLQVFGGLEVIQLRGLFAGGQSPYSALFDGLDHLRLLGGVGLFQNILRFTFQYYNRTFSPGLLLSIGKSQIHVAFNINSRVEGSLGAEFSIRSQAPRDGFNKKTPYKTYVQRAKERGTQRVKKRK